MFSFVLTKLSRTLKLWGKVLFIIIIIIMIIIIIIIILHKFV